KCAGEDLTDDAAVAEAGGHKVRLVAGNEENFKVTQAEDFARAEAQLNGKSSGITVDFSGIRTGTGFDVHRFGPGDKVIVCGVEIPHSHALLGHSDADVGMHAVTDAILGAIADGDIGSHFPPSDPKWKGAASEIFLVKAAELVRDRGGEINHVDLTIICEQPKMGPHRDAMRAKLAEILAMPTDRVGVKATTTEQLGFTGRGEGIAAQATATVWLK
ncbi:MAG TPA: 2-C-methyl-D-erythritol 2,4-cyclodiphosphate synthase, partial [Rhodospirillaceae bacterium]|nr:2-C-methyl-D-erythritol 2,4-cyclodiphosphate synthase [Rhodospirillaceae bacterium]